MWKWMLRTSGVFLFSSLFLISPASADTHFYVHFGAPAVYPGYVYPGYLYPGYVYPGYVYRIHVPAIRVSAIRLAEMHILVGTDIEPTGVADDMFDHTGVQRGRRGEGHMAAGMVGGATGADS